MKINEILKERKLSPKQADRPFILEKLLEKEPEAFDLQLLSLRLRVQQRAEERWLPWLSARRNMDERENVLCRHSNTLEKTPGFQIEGSGLTQMEAMEAAISAAPEDRDWTIDSAELRATEYGEFHCVMELMPYWAMSFLDALTVLGNEKLYFKEEARGLTLLELAASHGFEPAASDLLSFYDVRDELELVKQWRNRLLALGGPDALYMHGYLYLPRIDYDDDSEIPGNLPLAISYLEEAAELGSWRAALQLAEVYDNPAYGIQDPLQAAAWANTVPASVHYDGDNGRRKACRELRDELHDLENALACILPLADQGHSQDQCTAAALMEQLPTRKNEAYSYWMAAAQNGAGEAMLRVGKCLQMGELGVAPNFAEALAWFEKACVAGCSEAYFYAGEAYLKGIGTAPDPDRAYLFFKHAESCKTISGDKVE